MPLFVAIIGIKAFKALMLSKLAITLVSGFLVYQYLKANGMKGPNMMTSEYTNPNNIM